MISTQMNRTLTSTTKSKLLHRAINARMKSSEAIRPPSSSSSSNSNIANEKVPLLQTSLAMAAGIVAVASVSAMTDEVTKKNVPEFDPKGQQFNQSTFHGRFCRMLLACDPRLLLHSENEIRQYEVMLQDYERILEETSGSEDRNEMNYKLWKAHRVVNSAVNPVTHEIVPRPFRMSGYVPYNGPICVAMVASCTTPSLLFWGFVNQSQNALINYFNGTGNMSNETLAKSYSLAVVSALSVVFGLSTMIQKKFSPQQAKQLLRFTAFPSCVVASSLNCYFVRSPEIETGIQVLDESGDPVLPGETSQVAAKGGVYSTTLSRAILQAPVFFVPPFLMTVRPFSKLIAANPRLSIPMSTFLLLVSFGVGLPASVAAFPQIVEVPAKELESKYHNLCDKNGSPIERLYYNKGL